MAKHITLTLTSEQRQFLESTVRTGQTAARKLTRARILLLLDRSRETKRTDREIADILGCHSNTVGNLRRRFLTEGLEATLNDKPMGPTAPVKITGSVEAQLALLACSDPPQGRARWTLRLLANRTVELGLLDGMSYESVRQTLKKMKLSPGVSRPGVSANLPPSM
jgi:transposase